MHCVASRFGYPKYRLSELSLLPISSDNRRSIVFNTYRYEWFRQVWYNMFCGQTYENWEITQLRLCQYDPISRIVRLKKTANSSKQQTWKKVKKNSCVWSVILIISLSDCEPYKKKKNLFGVPTEIRKKGISG